MKTGFHTLATAVPAAAVSAAAVLAAAVLASALGTTLSAVWPTHQASPSCTIFTVADQNAAFFGNNEDNDDARQGRVWFYPPRRDRYGVVLFGYSVGGHADVPVGGMNDQDLVVDSNALHTTRAARHPDKTPYPGSFFVEMLERCATIEQVREWVQGYDLRFLETQQVHVADRQGNAVVLGLDARGELAITDKSGGYLVSTNFSLVQDPAGRDTDRRYKTAAAMLETMDPLTGEGCAAVLEETALGIVMYSYIVDLKAGTITLFSRGDFNQGATLNVAEEMAKGVHSYDIEALVWQQAGDTHLATGTNWVAPLLLIIAGLVLAGLCYGVWRRHGGASARRFILIAGALVCLMVLSRTVLRIPIRFVPIPNLVTITFYLSFMAALVTIAGLAFTPWIALSLAVVGLMASEVAHCWVYGCSDELLPYVVFALSSYGLAAGIVALLRKRNLLLAVFAGWAWAFVGFYIPARYYYSVFTGWEEYVLLYTVVLAAANLLSIPVALVLNQCIRVVFKVGHLDEWILAHQAQTRAPANDRT
ncbi:MAG: hypothetical protein JXA89_13935 [Anaerolineae bacterium]|nr:hypothetical protein [Anaerolineae bacterium]